MARLKRSLAELPDDREDVLLAELGSTAGGVSTAWMLAGTGGSVEGVAPVVFAGVHPYRTESIIAAVRGAVSNFVIIAFVNSDHLFQYVCVISSDNAAGFHLAFLRGRFCSFLPSLSVFKKRPPAGSCLEGKRVQGERYSAPAGGQRSSLVPGRVFALRF